MKRRGSAIGVAIGLVAASFALGRVSAGGAPTPRPRVHWGRCTRRVESARCGHIEVALDPEDASAGTIAIGFELYPHKDSSRPSLGTIVATEGGPGYASTSSRTYYLDLYRPLRDRRDVLLVDVRGTGRSDPIDCGPAQSYRGNRINRIGLCGAQLGSSSDLYGTAFAADDLARVLDALGIGRIDLYGDSYGTFFGQTFAIRHPDRVRTLVLDSSYPVVQRDAWYRAGNPALAAAFRRACDRSPACGALPGDPVGRIVTLDDALRVHPLHGITRGPDGKPRAITVDPPTIAFVAGSAAYDTPVYRELDGAARAYLDPAHSDPAPLLRLVSENEAPGGAGFLRQSSEGEYDAVVCNDYPQLWDINAPIAERPAQYAAAVAYLRATDPHAFYPFTIPDWTRSGWVEYRACIKWPTPSNYVFPVPRPVQYPNVPTLVLSGDLDSLTWPAGAHTVADEFPSSTFVSVANGTHVTAITDFDRCTSVIVNRFVATRSAGDTSCAGKYNEVRMVEQFPRRVADATPAPQGASVHSSLADRKLATVVSNTVADVFPRWYNSRAGRGFGLRGGTFRAVGDATLRFRLSALRWTDDVAVSGTMKWDRTTGWIDATVTVVGPGAETAALQLRWHDWDIHAVATVQGQIGCRAVDLRLPAS